MVDTQSHSADESSGNSPERGSFNGFGAYRPHSPHSSDGEHLMGESNPNPPNVQVGDSEDSFSSGEDASPLGIGAQSDFSEVFRAAHSLTNKDRLEAVEERKKNQVLLDFILSLGFSLNQLNDFKSKGIIPQHPNACKVLDKSSASLVGAACLPTAKSSISASGHDAGTHSPPVASVSGAGAQSWSAVVAGRVPNPEPKVSLQYYPPVESDGKFTITPPVSVLQKGLSQWSNSLTGHFLHSKLPFSVVEPFVQKNWGGLGLAKVLLHAKGYYVFKFNTPADRDNILALGPWYISNKLLRLKPWREGLDSAPETCTKTPVWVKFHGVPYSYWTPEGLSFIASGVGKPLFLDKVTERMIPMNFARVCVEIGIHSPLPKSLSVTIINEEADSQAVVEVQVEYQSIPPVCLTCQTFGHSRLKCPKANYQWVPKSSTFPPVGITSAEAQTLPATAVEAPSELRNILPGASIIPESILAAPPTSPNPFAVLEVMSSSSPASCSSHLNDPLLCKLKEVDEKDRKDNLASGGDSGKEFRPSKTQVGATGKDSSEVLGRDSQEQKCTVQANVVGPTSAKKRNKGKGRKSPLKHPPPPSYG